MPFYSQDITIWYMLRTHCLQKTNPLPPSSIENKSSFFTTCNDFLLKEARFLTRINVFRAYGPSGTPLPTQLECFSDAGRVPNVTLQTRKKSLWIMHSAASRQGVRRRRSITLFSSLSSCLLFCSLYVQIQSRNVTER
jgi:hypothetical protein